MSERPLPAAKAPSFATGRAGTSRPPQRRQARLPTAIGPLACLLTLALLMLPARAVLALSDAQQLVVDAWRLVNQSYVEPDRLAAVNFRGLRQQTLERPIGTSSEAYDAIEAMLAAIGDPYTRMLRPAEYGTLRSNTRGTVSGVGLQLGHRGSEESIVVIAPLDDSPAAEAGVVSGTELLRVDDEPAESLGLEGAAAALRGPAGTRVRVQVRLPQGREREVVLERRQVDLRPVRWRRLRVRGHSLGYLRITQFSEPVPRQVREALEALAGPEGGGPVEGLILDLRNNSGGLVSAGLAVASALLDGAPIVVTEDRQGIAPPQLASPGTLYAGPMVTLVNGGTASASEILAGALRDGGRSPLAGTRTFGKGLIQTLLSLGDGSGLAVTVARYLTPAGENIQGQGLAPDLELPVPEPLSPGEEGDGWLEAVGDLLVSTLEAPGRRPTTAQVVPG